MLSARKGFRAGTGGYARRDIELQALPRMGQNQCFARSPPTRSARPANPEHGFGVSGFVANLQNIRENARCRLRDGLLRRMSSDAVVTRFFHGAIAFPWPGARDRLCIAVPRPEPDEVEVAGGRLIATMRPVVNNG